jgi:hypothetical protein
MKSNCSTVEYNILDDGSFMMVTDGLNLETRAAVKDQFSAVLSNPTVEPVIGQFNVTAFGCKFFCSKRLERKFYVNV